MVERQPQQEERMRQPLVTIDAVKSADQQSPGQQPRAMPFVLALARHKSHPAQK